MDDRKHAAEVERLAAEFGIDTLEERAACLPGLKRLAAAFSRLEINIDRAYSRMAVLERAAFQDALVPIPNRRAFVRELRRALAVVRRHETSLAIVYIDINNMKRINDDFGHSAGDAALLHVGSTLSRRIRSSDFVARIGGDEFAILMPGCFEREAALRAEELAREIGRAPLLLGGEPVQTQGRPLGVSIAFGVYVCSVDDAPETALAKADASMYIAKKEQRVA